MPTSKGKFLSRSLQLPRTVRLDDQLTLCIAPIRPEDRERIRKGIKQLTPETSYHRFFTPGFKPTEKDLAYLTDIDGDMHMAIGARDLTREGEPGIGVARYMRLTDAPDTAEAAVLVIDAYQGHGIGSILMAALSMYAAEHGVQMFRAYVLLDNAEFLRFLLALGGEISDSAQGAVAVRVPVLTHPDQVPDRPEAAPLLQAWALLQNQDHEPC